MADEQTSTQQQTPEGEKPKFSPNGNGNGNGNGLNKTHVADGQGHTKYAPAKDDAPSEGDKGGAKQPEPEKPKANPGKKIVIGLIAAAILIGALLWGIPYYHYSQTHVSTDDAYATGNLVNVSPIISGTLKQLTVEEGNLVKKGQLIARLDDSGPQASLRQAIAAYDAAVTQIPQARISLAYQEQSTDAAIRRAQAGIASQNAKTAGAQQQVALSYATIQNQVRQAESQVAQAQAQAASAQAQVRTAQATVQGQRQTVQTAQRAFNAAAENINAAQANEVKAVNDQKRYAKLVSQEAVTQQQADAADATAISATSQLEATRQQAAQAQSQVDTAKANVQQALDQLRATRSQAAAAEQQVEVARAGLNLVRANLIQIPIQRSNVANNVQQGGQAQADLANAQAGRQQIALRRQQIATYQAQAAQAKAALANAQVTVSDTEIYAPTDGQVVRKAVNEGTALSPGQTILTLTSSGQVWVTANFKETQLTDVRIGQPAEVEVDTFPGKIFKGRVQAIEEATGASTALLPPDNATGNFTKVVQRVPVRIELIAASSNDDTKYARTADIMNLRLGLSVTATVDTENAKQH